MKFLKIFSNDKFLLNVYWILTIFVILAKIALVSCNEIIAVPNDSAVFVRHALNGGGALGPPVGYTLWLRFVDWFGVPQRLAIEVLYLFSSVFVSLVLISGVGMFLSLVILFALAFNPVTFHLFDNALSDSFFVCFGLLATSFAIVVFRNIYSSGWYKWGGAFFLGITLGVMGVTRNETPLLCGFVIWMLIVLALLDDRGVSRWDSLKKSIAVSLCVFFVYAGTDALPAFYNFATKGVWAKTLASMPSHMKVLQSLSEIDSGDVDLKRVSISKKSRLLAYSVSPTLSLLKNDIERDDNMYIQASHRVGGLPVGEVGGGWVWHIFNEAAIKVIPEPKNIESLDSFWKRVDSELQQAFDKGSIKKRFVIHPLIGAGVFRPFSDTWGGMQVAINKTFHFMPRQEDQGFISNIFDQICNRRASLLGLTEGALKLQGWVFVESPKNSVLRVQLGLRDPLLNLTSWQDLTQIDRPDVDGAFSKELGHPVKSYGFNGEVVMRGGSEAFLRYLTSSGETVEKNPQNNSINKLGLAGGGYIYRGIDYFEQSASVNGESQKNVLLQGRILNWGGWSDFRAGLFFIGLVAFFTIVFVLISKRQSMGVSEFSCILLLGVVFQRLVFYGLVNENSWEIEPRYMSPVFGMMIISIVCFSAWLVRFSSRMFCNRLSTRVFAT